MFQFHILAVSIWLWAVVSISISFCKQRASCLVIEGFVQQCPHVCGFDLWWFKFGLYWYSLYGVSSVQVQLAWHLYLCTKESLYRSRTNVDWGLDHGLKWRAIPVGMGEKFYSVCRSTGCRHKAMVPRVRLLGASRGLAAIGHLVQGCGRPRDCGWPHARPRCRGRSHTRPRIWPQATSREAPRSRPHRFFFLFFLIFLKS